MPPRATALLAVLSLALGAREARGEDGHEAERGGTEAQDDDNVQASTAAGRGSGENPQAGRECPVLRCLDHRPVLAAAGPWAAGLTVAGGIGVFFASYGKVTIFVSRQFRHRVDLELDASVDAGRNLVGMEGALRLGVLLHVSRRIDLLLAWRAGYAGLRAELPADAIWVNMVHLSVGVELRFLLLPRLDLRVAPLVASGYWMELWGFTVEPSISVAYRFGGSR